MTTLDNLKTRVKAVWNGLSSDHRQAIGQRHQDACRNACQQLYRRFNLPFDNPGDQPYDIRDPMDLPAKLQILQGLASTQMGFLNANTANRICIQDHQFLFPPNPQNQNYEPFFLGLQNARLCNCFYHFNYPTGQQQPQIRMAVNVHPDKVVAAVNDWLLPAKQGLPGLTSFKVVGPHIMGKPDSALLYINSPQTDLEHQAVTALVQTITQWQGQGTNELRDWVHPLMTSPAAGIGIADDTPRVPQYAGISFTALRAVIATKVLMSIDPNSSGDAAANAVEAQLQNHGINPQDPSRNAALPNQQMLDAIASHAVWLGQKVQ